MNGIGAYLTDLESGTDDTAAMIAVAVWAGLIGIVINAVFTGPNGGCSAGITR